MADPEVCSFITKILCARGGRLALDALLGEIALSEAQLCEVLEAAGPGRFVLLEAGGPAGVTRSVVATTAARVCRRKFCRQDCGHLHLCKLNLLGRCHYTQADRHLCKYSHDVLSEDNFRVLKRHQISGLNKEELAVLLVQNDPFFLPEICKDYKGEGRKKICAQQPCERLHICEHFTRGNCGFSNCIRSHNLMDRKVLVMMREHGLSREVVQNIQDICNSKHSPRRTGLRGPSRNRDPATRGRSKSRDRFFHGSQEFLPSAPASDGRPGTPGAGPTGRRSPPEDVPVEDLTCKFKHLESQDGPPPSSAPPKATDLGGSEPARGTQRFSENGSPEGLFCGSTAQRFPFSDNHSDGTATDVTSTRPVTYNTTTNRQRENSIPRSQEIRTTHLPFDPVIVDDSEHREQVFCASKAVHYTTNGSTKVTYGSADVPDFDLTSAVRARADKDVLRSTSQNLRPQALHTLGETSAFTSGSTLHRPPPLTPNGPTKVTLDATDVLDFDFTSAIRGDTDVFRSTSQNLRPQALHTLGETTAHTSPSTVPKVPPLTPSSNNRATASEAQGQNSAQMPVTSASELARKTLGYTLNSVSDVANTMDDPGLEEICLDHLYKGCRNRGCDKVHFHLPYRWQVMNENTWVDLQPMENIEKAYCDPHICSIPFGNLQINFQKMTCGLKPIRRISTPSSVRLPDNTVFATKWVWYWKSGSHRWVPYGEKGDNQQISSIDSSYLESVFLCTPRGIVPFHAGSEIFELSFQGMMQTNIASKTQKDVVRRPTFVSAREVAQLKSGPE